MAQAAFPSASLTQLLIICSHVRTERFESLSKAINKNVVDRPCRCTDDVSNAKATEVTLTWEALRGLKPSFVR